MTDGSFSINDRALSRAEIEWGLKAVEYYADEAASRSRDLTGGTITAHHSARQDYYSAPGMLRESIYSSATVDSIGPVGRIHYATPLGFFRNMSGLGHAAYSQAPVRGRIAYQRRLRSGRLVTRYRRIKADASLFGRGRGDWRAIYKALESMRIR